MKQLTIEHGFELWEATYMQIFLNKYVLQYCMLCSSTVGLYGIVLYPLYILAICCIYIGYRHRYRAMDMDGTL